MFRQRGAAAGAKGPLPAKGGMGELGGGGMEGEGEKGGRTTGAGAEEGVEALEVEDEDPRGAPDCQPLGGRHVHP